MTEIIKAVFLGALQGLTEFLPISSSGHLVIFSHLINLSTSLTFDIAVHAGSLLAVVVYFRRDIADIFIELRRKRLADTLLFKLLIATVPAAVFGITLKDLFESLFSSPLVAVYMLYVTALLLASAEFVSSRKQSSASNFTIIDALVIGFFQALALLPGISRSGSTITGGLLTGHDRVSSTRFSFLLTVPAIGGAFLYDMLDRGTAALFQAPVMAGFFSSFVFSLLAISLLLSYIRRHSYYIFAVYCAAAATIFLFLVK